MTLRVGAGPVSGALAAAPAVASTAAAGAAAPPSHRTTSPSRWATAVSFAAVGAVLGVELLVPGGWGGAAWVVLVVGLLAGLPHGAVDHLVPRWVLAERAPRLLLVLAGYVAVAAAAHALFRLAPGPALVAFVVLSAVHFGTGETAFDDERAGRVVRRDALGAAAFGGTVIVLPVVGDPGQVTPVIAALVPGSTEVLPGGVRAGAGALVALLVVGWAVRSLRRGRVLPVAELGLLVALAVVVSPLAAFGAYFGAWHALRHTARLVETDPASALDLVAGRAGRPWGRFALKAALPTTAALGTLLVLWSVAGGWRAFVAADLALLAGLTVPHVLVVAWSDRRSGAAGTRA